jgi:hypothetical protein
MFKQWQSVVSMLLMKNTLHSSCYFEGKNNGGIGPDQVDMMKRQLSIQVKQ